MHIMVTREDLGKLATKMAYQKHQKEQLAKWHLFNVSYVSSQYLPPMLPEPHPRLVQRGKLRHFDGTPRCFWIWRRFGDAKIKGRSTNCKLFNFHKNAPHQSRGEDDEDTPVTFNQINIYFVLNVSQLGCSVSWSILKYNFLKDTAISDTWQNSRTGIECTWPI